MEEFPGRVGLQQRVLPAYRAAFFDALAVNCRGGLGVFAGEPQPQENIATIRHLEQAVYFPAHNQHILRIESPLYQCRQPGIIAWLEQWQPRY